MSFASFDFLIFLSLFFISIFFFNKHWKIVTILYSLFFYSYWNYLLCSLLVFTVLHTYVIGNLVSRNRISSKKYLFLGIFISLSILFVFKYFNFFVSDIVNINLDGTVFERIILPIGISFYTFQSISYLVDIYYKKSEPTSLTNLFVFLCFFPQLIAGPIVRASKFIPQIKRGLNININNLKKGLLLILWGYFLKLCVSNNLDLYISSVYNYIDESNTPTLIISSLFYSFLIYADFCGYSSIAIGILKILGFNIPANFLTPYFSKNLTDFWRRWHISLSSFLRDYLYIPLGGSRKKLSFTLRNILIVMTLGGLWHGASLNFVIWGFFHGIILCLEKILKNLKIKFLILRNIYTFILVSALWIPFSLKDFTELKSYINIFKISEITNFSQIIEKFYVMQNFFIIVLLIFFDALLTKKNFILIKNNYFFFGFSLIIIIGLILTFGIYDEKKFIYFQF